MPSDTFITNTAMFWSKRFPRLYVISLESNLQINDIDVPCTGCRTSVHSSALPRRDPQWSTFRDSSSLNHWSQELRTERSSASLAGFGTVPGSRVMALKKLYVQRPKERAKERWIRGWFWVSVRVHELCIRTTTLDWNLRWTRRVTQLKATQTKDPNMIPA